MLSKVKILYIGDVMGEAGLSTLSKHLDNIVKQHNIDVVLAQSENVTDGKGLSVKDYERMKAMGIHGYTSGNHTMYLSETVELLEDENAPITRPANYPEGTAGKQHKILRVGDKKIALITLLGSIVGKDANKETDNPLKVIDSILNMLSNEKTDAIVVNFHGDFSSEKVIIGHYLDGRVTAVIGDHWHVPTADARILKGGTAHISDVGMTGSLDSSLGVNFDSVIARWRDGKHTLNELELNGAMQLNAVVVEVGDDGLALGITQIRLIG